MFRGKFIQDTIH